MSVYHKDLPDRWINIIEQDEVLIEIWKEHNSEYEAVPEFLFEAVRGEMYRLKPILDLYGEPGLEMYHKLIEIESATSDTAVSTTEEGQLMYSGYFYAGTNGTETEAQEAAMEYVKAINGIYENEFEEEALMNEEPEIVFLNRREAEEMRQGLYKGWSAGQEEYPQMEWYEEIGDWFAGLDMRAGCEELQYILDEALYHISNDYYLTYYILWSVVEAQGMKNPFDGYFKLWKKGYDVILAAKDKVIVSGN